MTTRAKPFASRHTGHAAVPVISSRGGRLAAHVVRTSQACRAAAVATTPAAARGRHVGPTAKAGERSFGKGGDRGDLALGAGEASAPDARRTLPSGHGTDGEAFASAAARAGTCAEAVHVIFDDHGAASTPPITWIMICCRRELRAACLQHSNDRVHATRVGDVQRREAWDRALDARRDVLLRPRAPGL